MANQEDCIAHIVSVLNKQDEATGTVREDLYHYSQVKNIFQVANNVMDGIPPDELVTQTDLFNQNPTPSNLSPEEAVPKLQGGMAYFASKAINTMATLDLFKKFHTLKDTLIQKNYQTQIANAMEGGKNFKQAIGDFLHSPTGIVNTVNGKMHRYLVMQATSLKKLGAETIWGDDNILKEAIGRVFDPNTTKLDYAEQSTLLSDHLKLLQSTAARDLVRVGIPLGDTPRVLFNSHIISPTVLRTFSKEEFIGALRTLNIDREPYFGLSEKEIEEAWGSLYDLKTGAYGAKIEGAKVDAHSNIKDTYQNYAKSGLINNEISFKDANSFFKLAEMFAEKDSKGLVDYQGFIQRRMEQISRQVGLVEALGSKPQQTLDMLLSHFEDRMTDDELSHYLQKTRKAPDEPKLEGMAGVRQTAEELLSAGKSAVAAARNLFENPHPRAVLAELDGTADSIANTTLAKWGRNIRAAASLRSLGNVVFSQVTDNATKAAVLYSRLGIPVSESLNLFTAAASTFPTEQRKQYLSYLRANLDIIRLMMDGAGNTAGSRGDLVTKGMDAFFTVVGMKAVDRGSKDSTAWMLSNMLAQELTNWKKTGKLEGAMVEELQKFGFTDLDFQTMKTVPLTDVDGAMMVDMDHLMRNAPDPRTYERLLVAFEDIINQATPTPGIKEKAIMHQGLRKGTPAREALEMAMQFKAYPITMVSRVIPSLWATQRGRVALLSAGAASAVLWYMSDSVKQALENKTPRPLDRPETWMMMATRSGLGGIYSDILIQEYGKHGLSLVEVLAGPAPQLASDVASFIPPTLKRGANLATGGAYSPDNMLTNKMFVQKMGALLPDFALLQGIMDKILIDAILESVSPGYVAAKRRKLEEKGQQVLFE